MLWNLNYFKNISEAKILLNGKLTNKLLKLNLNQRLVKLIYKMSQVNQSISCVCTDWLPAEQIFWLNFPSYPPVWSRLCKRNAGNSKRHIKESQFCAYDVEIPNELWSLWGCLHPNNQIFSHKTRGKQTLACNLIACCAAKLYPLLHFTPRLMDSIVISGDRYYRESIKNLKTDEHNFSLEDLNSVCRLENISFKVVTEVVTYGVLYEPDKCARRNLAKGLIHFFSKNNIGILCSRQRSIAIGRDNGKCGGDYFMYDCQSMEYPLFRKGEGVPYLVRCKTLQMLLYCLVMALEVRCKKIQFTIHKVDIHYERTMDEEQEDKIKKVKRIVSEKKRNSLKTTKLKDKIRSNSCKR